MADDNTAMRLAYATSTSLALQKWALQEALTACGTGRLGHGGCTAEWTTLPLIMVRDDMLHTGDLRFASDHFDELVGSVLAGGFIGENGLLNQSNVLVDWPMGMRDNYVITEVNSVANAFSYYGMSTLADIAGWLGREEDEKRYRVMSLKLKDAINEYMWNGKAYCDGVCSETNHTAFHSSVYLLALGAVQDDRKNATWEYVKSRIDPLSTDPQHLQGTASGERWPPPPPPGERAGMPCGTYVSQFTVQALYEGDSKDHGVAGYDVLTSSAKNSWLNMIKQGATTTMEMWTPDEKPNLTWSHPWSASPGFLIPWYLFGMRPLSPGWATLLIRPAVGRLTHGEYTLPTIKGPLYASFQRDQANESFRLEVRLPLGTEGTISIPLPASYTRSRPPVLMMDGIDVSAASKIDSEGAYVTLGSVGPGAHELYLV